MIRLGVMDFREEELRGKVPFPSHPIKCIYYQCDVTIGVNLDQLTDVVFVMLLHYRLTLSPSFAYYSFWKEVTAHPTRKRWRLMLHLPMREEYLYKLL